MGTTPCWEVVCHYALPQRRVDLGLHQRGDSCTVLSCATLPPRACPAAPPSPGLLATALKTRGFAGDALITLTFIFNVQN